jgi:geranylgeranyl pyrophosphate synthase
MRRSISWGATAVVTLSCTLCTGLQPVALRHPAVAHRAPHAPAMTAASIDIEAPAGAPDPYKLVHEDLDFIKKSIKKLLTSKKGDTSALTSNGVLTMAAREFMDRKGKSFRPMLVLLIGRATDPDFATGTRHSKLAVIAEMIHTASLIHADVLEEHETDTTQGTLVHQEVALDVGNKVCILAGDFLLAKAAVELSLLDSSPVTEIVARGLESICEGGMQTFGAMAPEQLAALTVDGHLDMVRSSVAALIANACQCSAILSGHEPDSTVARACHMYGENLAIARELVKEADDMDNALRKARRSPEKLSAMLPSATRRPTLRARPTRDRASPER